MLLTQADVDDLSDGQAQLAINDIYARHGYIFRSNWWLNYYRQFSWYTESIPADQFSSSMLNSVEYENVRMLAEKLGR